MTSTVWADAPPEFTSSGFGPSVFIIDPTWSTSRIKAKFDAILAQQVDNEFGTPRYQFLFMPGTYGTSADPLKIQLGYYTSVAGLGASPNDVIINGTINVYNRRLGPKDCTALVNFWRSVENLGLNVTGQNDLWATSQAAPMRRVHVTGDLFLFDYQSNPGYASGGFIADSMVDGQVINGSQQQFITRNSAITKGWSNGVWNQVFSGVKGAPAQSFSTTPFNPPPYTTLPTSPVTREKPFLQVDSTGEYQVFVPAVQRDSAGTTWANGPTPGRSISLDRFFVAQPTDSAATINRALAHGKHLLLTPGIYHLDRTLKITHPHSIILGLGFATLVPDTGNVAITVVNTNGADVAGVMIDAGPLNSPALVKVALRRDEIDADAGDNADADVAADQGAIEQDSAEPSGLQDVFFRIGGATPGRATTSLIVNGDNVILDDIWAWRADHGNGVGWNQNVADTGLVVNGDSVIAYGLFVEHYQKYQVIWKGEKGRTIMFQNEMPYDPPNQAAWSHDGIAGWAALKVADSVRQFEGWGLGSYAFFNVNPSVHADHAFEVPVRPGVKLHDLLTVSLDGVSVINHVVNDYGPQTKIRGTPVNVVSYPPAP
ncbi:MAG: adenylyl cyclase [Chloroflexota bacterium]|nr:adenylyl cyclase [Chloroflexota bacterium]